MTQMKGITPIIAVLVLLLITVAIAGAAWVYITSYYGGMTKQQLEITSTDCVTDGAIIYLRNIGTEPVNLTKEALITREVLVAGSLNLTEPVNFTLGIEPWLYPKATQLDKYSTGGGYIGPAQVGYYKDETCNTSTDAVCRYTIIAAGRVNKVQIAC